MLSAGLRYSINVTPMAVSTRHLRAFLAVAQSGSVTRSSGVMRRAQSAITRSIQELERELAAELFERRAHGMLLTDFGRTLLHRVEAAFAEMDAARQAIKNELGSRIWASNAPIFSLGLAEQRLRVFVALIEQPHMPSVAEALGISQAAVSQSLREIESGLGLKLFERSSRGLQPTRTGQMLATHVKRSLAEIRIAEAEIASMKGLTQGHVNVGALSLGRTSLLPVAIARLLRKHPSITVGTVEGPFSSLASSLRAGDLDFILGALRPPDHTVGFVREMVARDVMAVVAGAHHPLARQPAVTLEDLVTEQWTLPQKGTPTRELFEAALASRRLAGAKVVVETADLSILRGLLLESEMLTVISPHLFQYELEAGSLAMLPIPLPETERQIGMLRRTESHPSPGARLLMEEIRLVGQQPLGFPALDIRGHKPPVRAWADDGSARDGLSHGPSRRVMQ
jgi:LysR family transcriptional regulator, regulator for genes of the gallate degradation pathway